jgi:hypothetical protein
LCARRLSDDHTASSLAVLGLPALVRPARAPPLKASVGESVLTKSPVPTLQATSATGIPFLAAILLVAGLSLAQVNLTLGERLSDCGLLTARRPIDVAMPRCEHQRGRGPPLLATDLLTTVSRKRHGGDMPIELSNQEINAALLQYDAGAYLAALVGTITAETERGFAFPIESAEALHDSLRRVRDLLESEIDPDVLRPLLEWWSPTLVQFVLPIDGPLDYSRKILLKVRSWKLVHDSGHNGESADFSPFDGHDDKAYRWPRRA